MFELSVVNHATDPNVGMESFNVRLITKFY